MIHESYDSIDTITIYCDVYSCQMVTLLMTSFAFYIPFAFFNTKTLIDIFSKLGLYLHNQRAINIYEE